jgi:hypothetical protein
LWNDFNFFTENTGIFPSVNRYILMAILANLPVLPDTGKPVLQSLPRSMLVLQKSQKNQRFEHNKKQLRNFNHVVLLPLSVSSIHFYEKLCTTERFLK